MPLVPQQLGRGSVQITEALPFPLAASANGRYLVSKASGKPVLLRGDAAWDAITQLSVSEMRTYLDDRASRGFNAVLVELIENYFSQSPPNNADGVAPFTGTTGGVPDFTTPNDTYWQRLDTFVAEAALRRINVLMTPLYQGSHGGLQGWYNQMVTNGDTRTQQYGTFLGSRYRNAPNVIWVIGGDLSPSSTPTALSGTALTILENFTTALLAADPNHLTTTHWDGNLSSDYGTSNMWALNAVYQGPVTHSETLRAYAVSPTIPCFLIESVYEGNTGVNATRQQLRSQYWQLMTSGGCGGVFGDEHIWPFGGTRTVSHALFTANNGPWTSSLGSNSTLDFKLLMDFMSTIAWHMLVPDSSSLLVTSGRGTLGTSGYVCAAQSADQKLALIYNPAGATISIDKGQMQRPFTATWIDPVSGATSAASGSPFSTTGSQSISTPGNNSAGDADWGLLLQS